MSRPLTMPGIVPKPYAILSDALDEGLGFALNRVLDDLPAPDDLGENTAWRERVVEKMHNEVMNAICARFAFIEPEES